MYRLAPPPERAYRFRRGVDDDRGEQVLAVGYILQRVFKLVFTCALEIRKRLGATVTVASFIVHDRAPKRRMGRFLVNLLDCGVHPQAA